MAYKYDLPTEKAENLRKEFNIKEKIPVRYSRFGRIIDVIPEDVINGKPLSPDACAVNLAFGKHGIQARVFDRTTALLEKDQKGKLIIMLYANTYTGIKNIAEFDKSHHMITNGFRLHPIPSSWMPEARKRMAKERAARMKEPDYTPRPYKKRAKNENAGMQRASFNA